MRNMWIDVRGTLRMFRTNPVFVVVVVITLALGIGAHSAIFTVLNAVVLRPLPFSEPHELAAIWLEFGGHGVASREIAASEPEYLKYRSETRAFADIVGYWIGRVNLGGVDEAERVQAAAVSANFLRVMGTVPMLGRGFSEGEDLPGAEPVVMISFGLWQRSFGGDSGAIGRMLLVNGNPATVIAVLPRAFAFPGFDAELLRMNSVDSANPAGRSSHYVSMFGRLDEGMSVTQAQAEARALVARWQQRFPERHGPSDTHPLVIADLHDRVIGNTRSPLWILTGAVALVLLIACANVANLLMVRGEARQREIAIRTALGATRGRLMVQLLTGTGTLGGAALGLVGAMGASRLIQGLLFEVSTRDPLVFLGGPLVLLITAALAAYVPATRAATLSPMNAIRLE